MGRVVGAERRGERVAGALARGKGEQELGLRRLEGGPGLERVRRLGGAVAALLLRPLQQEPRVRDGLLADGLEPLGGAQLDDAAAAAAASERARERRATSGRPQK